MSAVTLRLDASRNAVHLHPWQAPEWVFWPKDAAEMDHVALAGLVYLRALEAELIEACQTPVQTCVSSRTCQRCRSAFLLDVIAPNDLVDHDATLRARLPALPGSKSLELPLLRILRTVLASVHL